MLRTLQHPIKLLLNPDHVLFELGLGRYKLVASDVVLSQVQFDAIQAGVHRCDAAVERLDNTVTAAQHRDTGSYCRL